MIRYIIVSIVSGFTFGFLDGLINGNPFAQELFLVFKPISKSTINIPAGIVIDLIYGFAMAGLFLVLFKSLPGKSALIKGLFYGLIIWFFRVVMYVVTVWMIFIVPSNALLYILFTGLGEMLIIGAIYGASLKPRT
ncbi:MAG: hypothetical protein GY757_38435 [bacterium]|nr:hypothetical protein [bacterium]